MRPTKTKSVQRRVRDRGDNHGWEALRRFRVIFGAVQRHYGMIERHCGVGGAQLWALSEIARRPGLSVRELSSALAVHQTTASNLIERLRSLGLVRRTQSHADRRITELFPTARGRALLRKAPKPAIGILQDALTQLPSTAVAELNTSLDRLIYCMNIRSRAATAGIPLSQL